MLWEGILSRENNKFCVKLGSVVLVYMLVISSFLGLILFENNNSTVEASTYYVGGTGPGNHSTIQSAIDAAGFGDTVYVYNGKYDESLIVNKTINLIGEDRNKTIINGTSTGDVVYINVSGVVISGFTINNSGIYHWDAGIEIFNAGNCSIENNNISLNGHYGILLNRSSYCSIENNNISSNNDSGIYIIQGSNNTLANNELDSNNIYLSYSSYNTIISNDVIGPANVTFNGTSNYTPNKDPLHGIMIYWNSNHNYIFNNNIKGWSGDGIRLEYAMVNNISKNNIENNSRRYSYYNGLELFYSNQNTIFGNIIKGNGYYGFNSFNSINNLIIFNKISNHTYSIYLGYWDSGNVIYLNEFMDNVISAWDTSGYNSWNSTIPLSYIYNNAKFTSQLGNYWDDYNGTDPDGDGIGNTPYNISTNKDYYPLVDSIDNYTLIPSTTHAVLTETCSNSTNVTVSLLIQNATLNAIVSGTFNGTLNFTNLEIVLINSSYFAGKGFFKANWTGVIEGNPYSGTWRGMLFKKSGERKFYLKGTVFGGLTGITDGYFIESVNGSGNYDLYNSTWTISYIGHDLVFALLTINGTVNYQKSINTFSEIYILQSLFQGDATGYYNGSLSVVLTHIRINNKSSRHHGLGFSIMTYVSTHGTGCGWTYDVTLSPGIVKLTGFFTKPLWGLVFGILNETGAKRTLTLTILRIDLGTPPKPILDIKLWGTSRVSPGQTINILLEYRNSGLKAATNTEIVMSLPVNVTYISNLGGGSYNSTSHEVTWRQNISAKSRTTVSTKCKVKWGLPWGTILLFSGHIIDFVQNQTLVSDSFTIRVTPARDPNVKYGPDGNVTPGEKLNYTIEYENIGSGIAYGVYFTDELDENLNDSTLEIGPVISTDNGSILAPTGFYNPTMRIIIWFVGEVTPGSGGYANISINVEPDAPHGTMILNYGTVYFPSVPETTPTNGIVSVVKINQGPVANAGTDMIVLTLQNIIFNASGSYDPDGMLVNYTWNFGDGEIGYGKFTSHKYLNDGKYVVNLTVKDDWGIMAYHEITVTVLNRAPEAKLTADFTVVKTNSDVTFDATTSLDLDGIISEYYFDFGDGTNSGWIQTSTVSHKYSDGTKIYTAKLTVKDDDGEPNTNTAEVKITVNNRVPVPVLSADLLNAFTYEDILFSAELSTDSDGTISSYFFDFGDGTYSDWITTSSVSHQYTDGTTKYTVSLTVKDNDGALSVDVSSVEIQINNRKPVLSLIVEQYDNYVLKEITFDASGSYDLDGELEYYFDFGDGANSSWITNPVITHVYTAGPQNYFILLLVMDDDGVFNETGITIRVKNRHPQADAGYDQNVVVNQIVNFNGDKSLDPDGGTLSYNWVFGDSTSSGWLDIAKVTHTYTEAGEYTVTLTVSDGSLTGSDTCIVKVSEIEEAKPIIKSTFPTVVDLDEDFGEWLITLTEHESHENPGYTGDDLKWYVTGNSGTIFEISGDNSTGETADTIVFTSVIDQNGEEDLTYHLTGPAGLEATINQKVIVHPINDPPSISELPEFTLQVGEVKALELEQYLSDVDSEISKLTLEADDPVNVNVAGRTLSLEFDTKGDFTITITVTDGSGGKGTSLLLVHVLKPDTIDSDGDGLPDAWEELYGLDPTDFSDAQLDNDNDLLTNLQEFEMGTDPTKYDTDLDGIDDGSDPAPLDPTQPTVSTGDDKSSENIYLIVSIIIFIIILLIGILTSIVIKNRNKRIKKPFDSDELIRELRDEIIEGDRTPETETSDTELKTILKKNYENGDISEETYDIIEQENLIEDLKVNDKHLSEKENK